MMENITAYNHRQNCFFEALQEILEKDFGPLWSSLIVNRHWNFVYVISNMDYKTVNISWGIFEDILSSLNKLEKIDFEIVSTNNVEIAEKELIFQLEQNQYVMICTDIFFLSFFPKRAGHDTHVLIAKKVDTQAGVVFVSSPKHYEGWISLKNLSIARNSRITNSMIQNKYFKRISSNEQITDMSLSDYISETVKINLNNMTVPAYRWNQVYGIAGMERFKEDLQFFLSSLGEDESNCLLRNIFKSTKTISEERKRYVNFLSEVSKVCEYDLADFIKKYKKISFSWDIFRNMCLKKTLVKSVTSETIVKKFEDLIEIEKKALSELSNIFKVINGGYGL